MGKINISGLSVKKISDVEATQHAYQEWRKFRKESQETFFIIPTGLKEYLPYFYTKALNLFLYYCFHAKNETGESWHSIETISKSLGVSTRTINKWNTVLEKAGLIYREANNHLSKSTFLLPISNYYIIKPNITVFEYLQNTNSRIDGELKGILHMFQWRKNTETGEYTQPYNVYCCIFEREHQFEEKIFKLRKYVFLDFLAEPEFKIAKTANELADDVYKISITESKLMEKLKEELEENLLKKIEIHSLAINSKFNLLEASNSKNLTLLEALNANLSELKNASEI